ncbi:hypothetical protein V8C86DRAFT_2724508 [Haematococcus lacustris]
MLASSQSKAGPCSFRASRNIQCCPSRAPLAGVRTFRAAAANETEAAPVGPATLMRRMGTVALSLFMPYKQLPPEGRMIDKLEEECDPYERNCRTLTYVYETQCMSCSGTGWSRGRHNPRRSRARGSLHVCLKCHGVGHVRHVSGLHPSELHDGSPSAAAMASPLAVLRKVPADAEHGSRVAAAPMKRHLHIEQEPAASVPANGSRNASSSGTGQAVCSAVVSTAAAADDASSPSGTAGSRLQSAGQGGTSVEGAGPAPLNNILDTRSLPRPHGVKAATAEKVKVGKP